MFIRTAQSRWLNDDGAQVKIFVIYAITFALNSAIELLTATNMRPLCSIGNVFRSDSVKITTFAKVSNHRV